MCSSDLDDLDVMLFRDGKVRSALSVTSPNVTVGDGELNIHFEASAGEPILSGLSIRAKMPPGDNWQFVWGDEFDGDALDEDKWSLRVWPPRKVNDEDQAYTDRAKNVRLKDGHLVIEAHREDYDGARYTSGRVHSQGKADFLYGRFEVRAKLPRGQGTWPAIWLLPSDPFKYASNCEEGADWQGNRECDAWPNSGEIDLMEHVGFESGHIHGTVHTAANYWVNGQQRKGRLILPPATSEFHLYALEWRPDRIDIFVDETRYFSYHRDESDAWQAWPFDQPFHLILNLAVGGNWGRAGGPIAEHEFPQKMLVDSVKVYQLAK